MKANAWLSAGVGAAVLCSLVALSIGLIPLFIRPDLAALGGSSDPSLVCLFMPTRSDWEVHLTSYFFLGLLLFRFARGGATLVRQLLRTRQIMRQLLAFARPIDGRLGALLHELGLAGGVDLVASAEPLAFCYGLLRPRICLSTGMVALMERQQLAAVLLHERYHLLRHDPLKVAAGRAVAASFCFLPVGPVLYARYLLAKEVEADGYASRQQGGGTALLDALCLLLDYADDRTRLRAGIATAESIDALETRVDGLLGQPPRLVLPLRPLLFSALLLLGILSLQWLFAQSFTANAIWQLQHSASGGC